MIYGFGLTSTFAVNFVLCSAYGASFGAVLTRIFSIFEYALDNHLRNQEFIPFASKLCTEGIAIFLSDQRCCYQSVYAVDDHYRVSWILRELYRIDFGCWNDSWALLRKFIGSEKDRNGYCGESATSTHFSPACILRGEEHTDGIGLLWRTDVLGLIFNSAGVLLMESEASTICFVGSKDRGMWP